MAQRNTAPVAVPTAVSGEAILAAYKRVREQTEALAAPLSAEDQCAQSMPDASPAKWHRAHTTWFFDTFVVQPFSGVRDLAPAEYAVMFNSYYNAVGEQFHRPSRGLLTRPSADEVAAYRERVDSAVAELLLADPPDELLSRVELGLHHEQQHQELLLTDIKHLLSHNPLQPQYARASRSEHDARPLKWKLLEGRVVQIGHADDGFHFDNEGPEHEVLLHSFAIANRLTTCGEYQAFIDDGGYARPELWLSAGWDVVRSAGWEAPAYWRKDENTWSTFTLHGRRPVEPHEPVTHVSYFEADAFARWAGGRLPTEAEWEAATPAPSIELLGDRPPVVHPETSGPFGACWQWTSSSYNAYPGYRPAPGAIGEYNGKFMCGQYVLRGSSCVTPAGHARLTYRNFFPPTARWQFSGIRLAKDIEE